MKNKKNIINLSSAEYAHSVVKVNKIVLKPKITNKQIGTANELQNFDVWGENV